jgi:hypothetical protein
MKNLKRGCIKTRVREKKIKEEEAQDGLCIALPIRYDTIRYYGPAFFLLNNDFYGKCSSLVCLPCCGILLVVTLESNQERLIVKENKTKQKKKTQSSTVSVPVVQ